MILLISVRSVSSIPPLIPDFTNLSLFLSQCYGLNCVSSNSFVEAQTLSVALFEYRAQKEVIKVK